MIDRLGDAILFMHPPCHKYATYQAEHVHKHVANACSGSRELELMNTLQAKQDEHAFNLKASLSKIKHYPVAMFSCGRCSSSI